MSSPKQRLPAVDLLKAAASQLIVLHHLAAYGPLSEAVEDIAPGLIAWFYDHGRMAVQVFLVIGGYLTARNFMPVGQPYAGSHFSAVANRYLRLVVPFLAALTLAVTCAAVARLSLDDDFVPAAPTVVQALSHVLLLQGILGHEALTAGAWYVAIDLQLFVVLILLSRFAAAGRSGVHLPLMPWLAGLLMVASLFWFNRDTTLDNWAPYFFGAYGLGAATWWASRARRPQAVVAALAALTVAALLVDFRGRIAVALATALFLALAGGSARFAERLSIRGLQRLGEISYSLFLVHFPVLMLANAIFVESDFDSPVAGAIGLAATWAASLAAAVVFHRWVEAPANRLRVSAPPHILLRGGLRLLHTLRRMAGALVGVRA